MLAVPSTGTPCLLLDPTQLRIFAVHSHPAYNDKVRDFLIATCEPVTRPSTISEFVMSSASLTAAASEGVWTAPRIARQLVVLSRTDVDVAEVDFDATLSLLPRGFAELIREMHTSTRFQLLLHQRLTGRAAAGIRSADGVNNNPEMAYYLSTAHRGLLEAVLQGDILRLVCVAGGDPEQIAARHDDVIFTDRNHVGHTVFKAEVRRRCLRELRKAVQVTYGFQIDVSYDYTSDKAGTVSGFTLRSTAQLRPYQEASLERFLRGGLARNGIIVLPCGAGKTLTGIAAAAAIGKTTLVICVNELSVRQWKHQFLMWSTLRKDQIAVLTGKDKEAIADVLITTYTMMGTTVNVREDGTLTEDQERKAKMMMAIDSRAWGLLILDEVHGAPAADAQRILDRVRYHCVLGLTATLLREDGNIGTLRHLVGPKLYEANWLELTAAGHLATAHCVEVRCPTPVSHFDLYRRSEKRSVKTAIEAMNPNKLWCVQALVHYHTHRSPPDKVIIFIDSTSALQSYAHALGLPLMQGRTNALERHYVLSHFKKNSAVNCIILSRVGDTALDLPEATVIIEVSGLGGSRRQEAQRLGRILRPKPPSMHRVSAVFYSLVSTDTDEVSYAFGRQQWLRDQGFSYRQVDAADIIRYHTSRKHLSAEHRSLVCIGRPVWQYRAVWLDRTPGRRKRHLSETQRARSAPAAADDDDTFVAFPLGVSHDIEKAFVQGHLDVQLPRPYGRLVFDPCDLPRTQGVIIVPVPSSDDLPQQHSTAVENSAIAPRRSRVTGDVIGATLRPVGDATARCFLEGARAALRDTRRGADSSSSSQPVPSDEEVRLRVRRGDPLHRCDLSPSSPCVNSQLSHLRALETETHPY